MAESPSSLADICLFCLSDQFYSLSKIFSDADDRSDSYQSTLAKSYVPRDYFLPSHLATRLITVLNSRRLLNEFTLRLFTKEHCTLTDLFIKDEHVRPEGRPTFGTCSAELQDLNPGLSAGLAHILPGQTHLRRLVIQNDVWQQTSMVTMLTRDLSEEAAKSLVHLDVSGCLWLDVLQKADTADAKGVDFTDGVQSDGDLDQALGTRSDIEESESPSTSALDLTSMDVGQFYNRLSTMQSLTVLDVSNTDFSDSCLALVCSALSSKLQSLNIGNSGVTDIGPLVRFHAPECRLQWLSLHDLHLGRSTSPLDGGSISAVDVIAGLTTLVHLDLSISELASAFDSHDVTRRVNRQRGHVVNLMHFARMQYIRHRRQLQRDRAPARIANGSGEDAVRQRMRSLRVVLSPLPMYNVRNDGPSNNDSLIVNYRRWFAMLHRNRQSGGEDNSGGGDDDQAPTSPSADISDDALGDPLDDDIDVVNLLRLASSSADLAAPSALPNLASVDLSGRSEVTASCLVNFVESHPAMTFIGLMRSDVCHEYQAIQQAKRRGFGDQSEPLVIAGTANEEQAVAAIQHYTNRQAYTERAMFSLYRFTQVNKRPPKALIELIVKVATRYSQQQSIQMAATACIFNLSRGLEESSGMDDQSSPSIESANEFSLHPHTMRIMLRCVLQAMATFPDHQQLQKNVLLTICHDKILQTADFDRYLCAQLVSKCLVRHGTDPVMARMCVAICSIIASRLTNAQASEIGSKPLFMNKLLYLVKDSTVNCQLTATGEPQVYVTLKFTLSALWNLTDECPNTCFVFLTHSGLDLYMCVLERFAGEVSVENKVLGLFNNVAEVPDLRVWLVKDNILKKMCDLMKSNHLDVAYFATGIVAHLVSVTIQPSQTVGQPAKRRKLNSTKMQDEEDGIDDEADAVEMPSVVLTEWSDSCQITRDDLLADLESVVSMWTAPSEEMVAYRSFLPFFPLMSRHQPYSVKLWAVWAIHHVCLLNPKRYFSMLLDHDGQGLSLIKEIASTERDDHLVADDNGQLPARSLLHRLSNQIIDQISSV